MAFYQKVECLQVLGLPYDATEDEIKKAYKKLALEFHPDKCPGDNDATKRFQEISEAYCSVKKIVELEKKYCGLATSDLYFADQDLFYNYYESSSEEEEELEQEDDLLHYFKKVFMDVLAEFVFKKKFQSKRKQKDTISEENEEDIFFDLLSEKFRCEEGDDDSYLLTEEDLKKFQSFDEWQKSRDPSKPYNRCKRKAVQKSRRYKREEQKQINKKQLKAEHIKKEKELKEIRDQLLKNLDEKKQKDTKVKQNEILEAKKEQQPSGKVKCRRTSSETNDKKEIEKQMKEAAQKELEFETKQRLLEASENQKAKKLHRQEKKKARKKSSKKMPFQFEDDDFVDYRSQPLQEVIDSNQILDLPKPSVNSSATDKKKQRDENLKKFMENVKKKTPSTQDQNENNNNMDTYEPDILSVKERKQKSVSPGHDNSSLNQDLLSQHLGAYYDLMKHQPKRHTEQQLKQERNRIKEAKKKQQQHELEELRVEHGQINAKGARSTSEQKRQEFLQKQREKERRRNEEELAEISRDVDRQHERGQWSNSQWQRYEKMSYHEKGYSQVHKKSPPPVEQPAKREKSRKQRYVLPVWQEPPPPKVENSWAERMRRQTELNSILPQNQKEEDLMLREALTLSRLTAELEDTRRQKSPPVNRYPLSARLNIFSGAEDFIPVARKSPPVNKFPLSDKLNIYPGAEDFIPVVRSRPRKEQPPKVESPPKPDKPKRRRRRRKRNPWSSCPGIPSEDDWSCTKSRGMQKAIMSDSETDEFIDDGLEEIYLNGDVLESNCGMNDYANRYSYHEEDIIKLRQGNVFNSPNSKYATGAVQSNKPGEIDLKLAYMQNHASRSCRKDEQLLSTLSSENSNLSSPKHDMSEVSSRTSPCESVPVKTHDVYRPTVEQEYSLSESSIQESLITDRSSPKEVCSSSQARVSGALKTTDLLRSNNDQACSLSMSPTQERLNSAPKEVNSSAQTELTCLEEQEPTTKSDEPSKPQKHDSFTQTQLSSGFVGGYWDSSYQITCKETIQDTLKTVDEDLLGNLPPTRSYEVEKPGFSSVKNSLPRFSQDGHEDALRRAPPLATSGHKNDTSVLDSVKNLLSRNLDNMDMSELRENWDLDLMSTDFSMPAPSCVERKENSIAVNTNFDYSVVPRPPAVAASVSDVNESQQVTNNRMMTDDQKLSVQQPSGQGTSYSGPSDVETVAGPMDNVPSISSSSLSDLGLPPHLVQAYLQYLSEQQNENQTGSTLKDIPDAFAADEKSRATQPSCLQQMQADVPVMTPTQFDVTALQEPSVRSSQNHAGLMVNSAPDQLLPPLNANKTSLNMTSFGSGPEQSGIMPPMVMDPKQLETSFSGQDKFGTVPMLWPFGLQWMMTPVLPSHLMPPAQQPVDHPAQPVVDHASLPQVCDLKNSETLTLSAEVNQMSSIPTCPMNSAGSQGFTHHQDALFQPPTSSWLKGNIPVQRMKNRRQELNNKIQSLIREIKQDESDSLQQLDIVGEENRIST